MVLKYDVIRKTGSTIRITGTSEEDRAVASGNMHNKKAVLSQRWPHVALTKVNINKQLHLHTIKFT